METEKQKPISKSVRQLKIQPRHFQRDYNQTAVFPETRLAGKWLHDIGFHCGQFVAVRHEHGNLITSSDLPPDSPKS